MKAILSSLRNIVLFIILSSSYEFANAQCTVAGAVTGGTTICSGSSSPTMTLSGNTGNVVKWQSSVSPFTTWTDIANTSATYTSGALTKTTQFRAVVQNGTCTAENSTATTVTVDPTSVGGTLSGGTTICSGSTSAVMTLSSNTGVIVKWQSSVSPFTTWTDIANTAATYTSGALTQTTRFRVVVQSGVCPSANSGITQVTVNKAPTLTEVAGQDQAICSGSSMTVSVSDYSGTIQWQKSSSPSFSPVNNVAGDFDMTDAPTSTTYYRAVVSNSPCPPLTSATVQITVDQPSIAGTVSANQSICSGNYPSSDITISGTIGTIQWESADDAAFSVNTDTPGTATTLTAATIGPLFADKYFRAKVTSGVCPYVYSAPIIVTVMPGPSVAALTGTQILCTGGTTTFASATAGGVWSTDNAAVATVSAGVISGLTAGAANISYTVTGGNGCPTTVTRSVTVNTMTSLSASPLSSTICAGNNVNLTGSAVGTSTGTLLNENFNNAGSTFTAAGNVSLLGIIFSQRSSPFGSITNNVDGSKFMVAGTILTGSGTTNSTLTSNVINTTGYTSVSISFNQYFNQNSKTTGAFEISSDGGSTWTSVYSPTPSSNFTTVTLNLPNQYINQANLKIRFRVSFAFDTPLGFGISWWAIDNVKITGTLNPFLYYWTATPSGSGLTAAQQTPSNSNTNITVNPTVTTSYILTAKDPVAGCSVNSSPPLVVNVSPANTISLSSAAGTNAQTVCINTSITNITYTTTGATGATFSGLPAGVSGSWAGNVVTISGTPSTVTGSPFSYTITLTGGCGSVNATGTIKVTPANTITLSSAAGTDAQTKCINTAITNITYTTTGATGATFSGLPAGVNGSWVGNVVTISGTPTGTGGTYTITLTGGCGTVTKTGTITVNPSNTITLSSAAGTDAQTKCMNTAITNNITYNTTGATGATFLGLPAGVNGSWAGNVVTISGTPTGTGGTYTITLTGGCGNVTKTGTITVNPANTITLSSAAGTDVQTICTNTAITNITYTTTGATGATFSGLPTGVNGSWVGNVVTISGTPAGTGGTYTITLTGGCGTVTKTGTITVNPANTITLSSAAGTDVQTICTNAAITNITYTTTGATGATFSGLPVGVNGSWVGNAVTISGTPTGTGGMYTITLTGGCGIVTKTGTITVNPANTITLSSAAGTDAQTKCMNTAITNITYTTTGATGATFSGLPAGVNGSWAGNVVTISGTPTGTGGTYTITLTGGCSSVNATGTITVTPNSTAGAASSTPTLCINTALTAITHTTTGATGIGTATNLPAGVSATWSSNTITISGTPTSTGIFNYSIPLTGGCGNINATGAITVNAPIAPTVGTITQPSCTVSTGSVVLSSLPAGNWTINPGNLTGSGTTTTISGLITGTINFTVTDAAGCTSLQAQVIISSGSSKQWISTTSNDWFTASNWSPTGVPDANTCVVVPNNTSVVSISGSNKTAYANTLTVTNGGKLDIAAGNNLVVTNSVNVNSGGTLTVQNSSDLIQINNSINTGNISLIRNTPPLVFNDYTYWSSPTTGSQTLRNFSPNSNPKYFLTYNNSWSYINAANTFTPGIGYAILAPLDANGSTKVFQFTGVPNNGDINLTVASGSTQLVGNPYPSALDAIKFINTNLGNISGTLYFWTHNQPLSGGTYPSGNYAVYNLTGGISNGPGTGNTSLPNGWIASGQGFIVEVTSAGKKISFTNDMRSIDVNYANSNFYRNTNKTGTENSSEKNRIWLNLTSADIFCQALVGYVDKATNSYDPGFDAVDNRTTKIGLYSLMENRKYMIQGRAPFVNNDIVPLGYKADQGGNLTISIDKVEGIFATNQDVFIEDKSTHILQNLKIAPYTFITKAGSFDDRFVLRYLDMNLGLNNSISENVTIANTKNQIEIRSTIDNIKKVFIYDMLGRTIYKNVEIDKNEILISDIKASQQVFILKVVLSNGHVATKKLFNQ